MKRLKPRNCRKAALLLAATAVLAAARAEAALTYVDATKSNTGPASAFTPGTNGQADDNLWTERTGFSINSTIFQSGDGDGEDSPELTTTISGLLPNSLYRVYVHFWDGSGTAPDWNLRAGFAPGVNTLFANPDDAADIGATGGVLASTLTYSSDPTPFVEADRTQYAGFVGVATSNGAGDVLVYIDDLPSTIGVNQRSWYDGVSYELVPEPASAALAALVAAAALAVRRRRSAA